jgi:hypothetical protein
MPAVRAMSGPVRIQVVGHDYLVELDRAPRALETTVTQLLIQELQTRLRPAVATRVLITFGIPHPK